MNLAIAPYLQAKLEHEYFIFRHSVAILLWSFIASMVVLAGAEWTARPRPRRFGYRSSNEELGKLSRRPRASICPRANWSALRRRWPHWKRLSAPW